MLCRKHRAGVDIHSCSQFLLELYSQWILPSNPSKRTPVILISEVVRSVSLKYFLSNNWVYVTKCSEWRSVCKNLLICKKRCFFFLGSGIVWVVQKYNLHSYSIAFKLYKHLDCIFCYYITNTLLSHDSPLIDYLQKVNFRILLILSS